MVEKNDKEKFNWRYVSVGGIVIIFGLLAFGFLSGSFFGEKVTAYCQYETTLNDVPRDQCGYLKIISRDITDLESAIHDFEKFGRCSESFDALPGCEGEGYYTSSHSIKDLCEGPDCEVNGVICSAYYMTYLNEDVPDEDYEAVILQLLDEHYETEEAMLEAFDACDI